MSLESTTPMTAKLKRMDVPTVGPKPPGDPSKMHALAARCRTLSASLETGSSDARNSVAPGRMVFNGRRAAAIRDSVDRNSTNAAGVADRMSRFASKLDSAADTLKKELTAYDWRVAAAAAAVANNKAYDAQNAAHSVPGLPGVPTP